MISTQETRSGIAEEIERLKKQKDAVILAHNYELPEVQDVADFVGDSLGLSREAEATDAERIVFCGVHFMAETASIICPRKKVLIPDLEAGCSLAATINAAQVREWKAKHPGAVVVSYVNTPAAVKAESDYCCTSSNAVKVVNAIPADKEILFLPDMFLGAYVRHVTRRNLHVWMGECHVHAGIRPEHVRRLQEEHQGSETLVHPECGCTTAFLYYDAAGDMPRNTYFQSTEGMTRHVRQSPAKEFIIVTEIGVLHRMEKASPDKTFIPASREALCPYMKMITLEKILHSLQEDVYEVKVPAAIASKARLAIDRMLRIG